jgi:LuxR family glucitol operon transcriptional activator
MQLAEITVEAVEIFLRGKRSGEKTKKSLLNLVILDGKGSTSEIEKEMALADLLNEIVQNSYLQFRQAEKLSARLPKDREGLIRQIQEDFSLGNPDLEAWSALYYRYMAVLTTSVEDLASAAKVVPQQFRRRINSALAYVVDHLRRLERQALEEQPHFNPNLPMPDYAHLIAVQSYLEKLNTALNQPDGAFMVSLEGLGGMGKTALARAFAADPNTEKTWGRILWVSARQEFFSNHGTIQSLSGNAATLDDVTARLADQLGISHLASKSIPQRLEGLQAALNMEPTLVVVDNLESVEEHQQLIPALAKLGGKTRFLITSRQTLQQFPYVFCIPLSELSAQNAYELVSSETERLGKSGIVDQETFMQLYELVGGIPLAIKLVAAQVMIRPLEQILTGFRQAKAGMDNLYRYLYWETWQLIGENARHLLLSFLASDPEGEDLEFAALMSGLGDQFYPALQDLHRFSLLEISGDVVHPRYRLHRLTTTFLQTDILNVWGGDDAANP